MRATIRILSLSASLAALVLGATPEQAKPPTLTGLFPAGARVGTTTRVRASGSFDQWPVRCWVDSPGVRVESANEKGTLWITVSDDAPAGRHWLRLYDDEGPS